MLFRVLTALTLLGIAPGASGAPAFKHVVIIFQENRTPDNLFGSNPHFEPGVDIATSGKNSLGATITLQPVSIASCYDVDHSFRAFTAMYRHGTMSGADLELVSFTGSCAVPPNPQFAYADNSAGEIEPYFDIARQFGFANRMFQTNQGPSFPAHQFIFGATSAPTETSRLFVSENMVSPVAAGCTADPGQRVPVIDPASNEVQFAPVYPCFERPTMATLLDGAGLSWRYYLDTQLAGSIWNAPAAIRGICVPKVRGGARVCTGAEYTGNVIEAQSQILTDIGDCNLPAVSWVIPNAQDSDHAGITSTTGPAWVASIVNAIGTQAGCPGNDTYWRDTAIFITWDDWGGWYDHVPPFHVGGWAPHRWGEGYTYGFRVPLLVVSAYTPAGLVESEPHDFGSILAFIEDNFGLSKVGPGYYADAFGSSLSAFFPLSAARAFPGIPAKVGAGYFLRRAPNALGPDND